MIPTARHIAHAIVKSLRRIRFTGNATLALILVVGLAAMSSAVFADATPDHFEQLGALPLAGVKSFDVEGTTISLLFDQTVALSNTALAGTRMSVRSLTPLRQSYDDCMLHDGRLILYSQSGALGLARVGDDTLVVVNEQTSGDSIFSVAIDGNYLYLAQGFDGIKIVDIGDLQVPRTVGKADHGGYYSQLAVRDTLLLAVDRLNGVDVFRIRDSALVYLRTLLTDWPVVDFAFDGSAILMCYGNTVVDRRQLDGSQEPGMCLWSSIDAYSILKISVGALSRSLTTACCRAITLAPKPLLVLLSLHILPRKFGVPWMTTSNDSAMSSTKREI